MKIEKDKVVSIHYTLKNEQGEVLDSSRDSEPLLYLHGNGNLIIGLEEELEGKTNGDTFNAAIAPEKAYGVFMQEKIITLPKTQFAGIPNLILGTKLEARFGEEVHLVTVTKITNEEITIDANHPLAGQTLFFEVEVHSIREASQEEISHGHVHGGGHHH